MNGTRLCSVSGSYSTYFILSYSLLSQSVENNSSTIRLYGTFQYGGGTSVGSSYSTFKVDGTTVKSGSYRYYPGDTQLGYKDITVTHNADGSWPGPHEWNSKCNNYRYCQYPKVLKPDSFSINSGDGDKPDHPYQSCSQHIYRHHYL